MTHIVWVHGIGRHQAGWSKPWQSELDTCAKDLEHHEVLWDTVMQQWETLFQSSGILPVSFGSFSRQENTGEKLRQEISYALTTRAVTQQVSVTPPPQTSAMLVGFSDLARWGTTGLSWDWINAGVGDFVRYLLLAPLRTAVKATLQATVKTLADGDEAIHVIAHSWGTVVAYEALHGGKPPKGGLTLWTLGSPLWAPPIRARLQPAPPTKPSSVTRWVNIAAHGDAVAGWLYRDYKGAVDRDYMVEGAEGLDAHSAYFMPGSATFHDLIGPALG